MGSEAPQKRRRKMGVVGVGESRKREVGVSRKYPWDAVGAEVGGRQLLLSSIQFKHKGKTKNMHCYQDESSYYLKLPLLLH